MSRGNIYIKSMGCKVNTFDSHALENQLLEAGFSLTEDQNKADISIINSCSVTETAEKEARYLLRRYKRENPDSLRVITGCYAQTDSGGLSHLDEVDYIIPNEIKEKLTEILIKRPDLKESDKKIPDEVTEVHKNKAPHFKSSTTLFHKAHSKQTRAFLKIQDGCNGFCSYCLIPYARGESRSVPIQDIFNEVDRLASTGCKEIVLTGIHIGDYGEDLSSQVDITHVVQKIVKTPGIVRVRISSLEPMEVSDSLLNLMVENKNVICNHFHLPLQSGSERILKLMRRKYTKEEYRTVVERIRSFFPHVSITADVIPGFPGETEEHHQETIGFIKDLKLAGLHVFPYSKRPNTAAVRMPGHLDVATVKERARELRLLSKELESRYARQFIGREAAILWENSLDPEGRRKGKTNNYLDVVSNKKGAEAPLSGEITTCEIKGFISEGALLVH